MLIHLRFQFTEVYISFNSRIYTQSHTPTMVKGDGFMEPHPRVFDMLQYFEKDFTLSGQSRYSYVRKKAWGMV